MKRASFVVNFTVKNSKVSTDGSVPIYMRITVNKHRAELSVKRTIQPQDWDQKLGKTIRKNDEATQLNSYLNQCRSRVYECQQGLEFENKPLTALNLKDRYLGLDQKDLGLIETFLQYNTRVRERIGVDVVPATYQKYSVCLKHLEKFIQNKYRRKDLAYAEVDHQLVSGFEHYLRTRVGQSHNTSVKTMRTFRTIIKEALNNQWLSVDPFAHIKLTLKQVDRERLNEVELNKMIHKRITNDRLAIVRDIFLFSCYTGLAYSDVKELSMKHLIEMNVGKWWIVKKRKKTQNMLRIPLLPQAQKIIDKYKDDPLCKTTGLVLPVRSNQKMNEYLKELAAICGIDKKISTHTGRHTFATTIALANNLSMEVVQSILGHSDMSMTKIYAKMVDKRVENEMDSLANRLMVLESYAPN